MNLPLGGAVGWLAEKLQPSGDAALRGLELDLARQATFDEGWSRACETAWTLGFIELRLVPAPHAGERVVERVAFAPRPWPLLDRGDERPSAQSTWAFELTVGGGTVATLTARRRLGRVDFEPMRFVAALQGLIDRFVAGPPAAHGGLLSAAGHPGEVTGVVGPALSNEP